MATELSKEVKKAFTKKTRDENIRIEEERRRKPPDEKPGKKITKEEIEQARKPKIKTIPKKEKPFLILKEQERLLAEPDAELVEEIYKSYVEESKAGESIRDKGDLGQKNLWFSNVGDCPREIYYKFYEPERARDYTVKGLILFDEGRRHHKNIQRRLEDRGKARNPEGFLEIPEVEATGYYDGLINVGKENGWNICDIQEIKSKLPYACGDIEQRDYDQAQLYHYAAQFSKRLKTKRIKIRNIRMFYMDRAIQTDQVYFGWMVKPDQERQQDIVSYFRFLKNTVIDGRKLVPHPLEKKSTKCTYCRFKEWCWREYPEIIEELEFDPDEIVLPDEEILNSYAKKLFEVLKKEAELKAEKKQLEPILIHYFIKMKKALLPVTINEGLAPKQGKRSSWDEEALRNAIGNDMYAKISKPDSTKITELIHREFVDAGKFEMFKKYKMNKPSIYIKKIQGGLDAD